MVEFCSHCFYSFFLTPCTLTSTAEHSWGISFQTHNTSVIAFVTTQNDQMSSSIGKEHWQKHAQNKHWLRPLLLAGQQTTLGGTSVRMRRKLLDRWKRGMQTKARIGYIVHNQLAHSLTCHKPSTSSTHWSWRTNAGVQQTSLSEDS